MPDISRVSRFAVAAEIDPGTGAGGSFTGEGVSSVVRTGAGVYTITLNQEAAFGDTLAGFLVTPSEHNAAGLVASWARVSDTVITVQTHLASTGAAQDATFTLLGVILPPGAVAIA